MSLFSHLELVEDKRSSINQHHDLTDVLFLIISAVLSGCEGWKDIEVFGRSKLAVKTQYAVSVFVLVLTTNSERSLSLANLVNKVCSHLGLFSLLFLQVDLYIHNKKTKIINFIIV